MNLSEGGPMPIYKTIKSLAFVGAQTIHTDPKKKQLNLTLHANLYSCFASLHTVASSLHVLPTNQLAAAVGCSSHMTSEY